MDGPAGDLDRISALPDNLLHVILGCLGSAPAVTRTAVLSRRWRHVWKGEEPQVQRLRHLQIRLRRLHELGARPARQRRHAVSRDRSRREGPQPCLAGAAQRVAPARHVVKSVQIDLGQRAATTKPDEQVVVEVPSHGRAESIWLALPSNYRLQLPAVARYPSLDEDGSALSHFVESCCPRFRRQWRS
ncbi:hypothetical protein EJB05_14320, partial [Eragrostis curvula]